MLILLQVINQMINLEYSKEEVIDILNKVTENHFSIETLFYVLLCDLPTEAQKIRFKSALPKRESAIAISFLRRENEKI